MGENRKRANSLHLRLSDTELDRLLKRSAETGLKPQAYIHALVNGQQIKQRPSFSDVQILNTLAVHEDRLQTCERVCTEYGRRCCGRVGIAVRIAVRMLDTVTDLTGRLDPVFGGVQIFPLSVGIVFQIVESGVGLGFNFDGTFRIAGISECCRRHYREEHERAEQHGNQFLCCFHTCPFLRVIK